jgi:hypothetical protein
MVAYSNDPRASQTAVSHTGFLQQSAEFLGQLHEVLRLEPWRTRQTVTQWAVLFEKIIDPACQASLCQMTSSDDVRSCDETFLRLSCITRKTRSLFAGVARSLASASTSDPLSQSHGLLAALAQLTRQVESAAGLTIEHQPDPSLIAKLDSGIQFQLDRCFKPTNDAVLGLQMFRSLTITAIAAGYFIPQRLADCRELVPQLANPEGLAEAELVLYRKLKAIAEPLLSTSMIDRQLS